MQDNILFENDALVIFRHSESLCMANGAGFKSPKTWSFAFGGEFPLPLHKKLNNKYRIEDRLRRLS